MKSNFKVSYLNCVFKKVKGLSGRTIQTCGPCSEGIRLGPCLPLLIKLAFSLNKNFELIANFFISKKSTLVGFSYLILFYKNRMQFYCAYYMKVVLVKNQTFHLLSFQFCSKTGHSIYS